MIGAHGFQVFWTNKCERKKGHLGGAGVFDKLGLRKGV